MSNWLPLDAKGKAEDGIEKERNKTKQSPGYKTSHVLSKENSMLIFVLTNQVSVFEAEIRDHSVISGFSQNFPPLFSSRFCSFLKIIFVLFFILPPLRFSIKSGQMSWDTESGSKVFTHPG